MISTKASIKETSTTDSSTTPKTPKVSDHSSTGNEYWTGTELNSLRSCIRFQFRMYYLKMKSAITTFIERKFVGFLTDFITGTPSIQPQMLSRKASTKKAPTKDSSTSPLSAIFPAYSSTDYGYWTGKEIQFIMFIYKFLCLCTFHVYSLSPVDIINIHFASLLDICKYVGVQTMFI